MGIDADRSLSSSDDLVKCMAIIAERLANLNFLITFEADNPSAVRRYAEMAADAVRDLG
jgi:hypothetical protein